jgi:hypothetical protein
VSERALASSRMVGERDVSVLVSWASCVRRLFIERALASHSARAGVRPPVA